MDGAPHGVALPSHMHPEERPLYTDGAQSHVLLPEVPMEKAPCDALTAMTELPAEALPAVPGTVTPTETDTELCAAELPPCPGSCGASACEVPSTVVLQMPARQPPRLVPRGRCLIHNWQEERATNHLDIVQGQEQGSEGFIHRHGHPRLLYHHHLPGPNNSTTMDTYCPPHSVLMLGQGRREAMLKAMLYHKYREEMLKKISPPGCPWSQHLSRTRITNPRVACPHHRPPPSLMTTSQSSPAASGWSKPAASLVSPASAAVTAPLRRTHPSPLPSLSP
ncbi:sperm-associated antigen 8 [Pezoporus occidentalis]|uniref:sperm-associated antigen 8 n=1 Tax=Pezoporus occidentalis TaxID=407982 RepID=UPI002F913167